MHTFVVVIASSNPVKIVNSLAETSASAPKSSQHRSDSQCSQVRQLSQHVCCCCYCNSNCTHPLALKSVTTYACELVHRVHTYSSTYIHSALCCWFAFKTSSISYLLWIQYALKAVENTYNNDNCSIKTVAYYINTKHINMFTSAYFLFTSFFRAYFIVFRFRLLPCVARCFCRRRVNILLHNCDSDPNNIKKYEKLKTKKKMVKNNSIEIAQLAIVRERTKTKTTS